MTKTIFCLIAICIVVMLVAQTEAACSASDLQSAVEANKKGVNCGVLDAYTKSVNTYSETILKKMGATQSGTIWTAKDGTTIRVIYNVPMQNGGGKDYHPWAFYRVLKADRFLLVGFLGYRDKGPAMVWLVPASVFGTNHYISIDPLKPPAELAKYCIKC